MESGLLSSFHDDHFDGNYSKYDNLDVWSDRNDGMGLQLSETLHGILPIAGNEEASHFFETDLEHRIPFRFETENDGLAETIIEMDKNMDEDYLLTSYDASNDMCESMSPSIEIISVDPNCEFSSPITIDDADEELDQHDDDEEDTNSDRCSSRSSNYSSNSSIADYESHSSDESDVENYDIKKLTVKNIDVGKRVNQIEVEKITKSASEQNSLNMKSNNNTLQNTILRSPAEYIREKKLFLESSGNDTALERELSGMKTFDLATYITQETYEIPEHKVEGPMANDKKYSKHDSPINNFNLNTFNANDIKSECKSDSDTEIIVDIETVHDFEEDVKPMLLRKQNVDYSSCLDVNEPLAKCDDDIKHDPSWSPKKEKATKACKPKTKPQAKQKRVNNLISQCNRILNTNCSPINQPIKCHFVMDRKKYGLGKGKNISMCTTPEIPESGADSDADSSTDHDDSICKKETRTGLSETNCAIDSNKLRIRITNLNGQPSSQNSNEKNSTVDFIPKADIKTEYPQPVIKQEHTIEPKPEKCDIKLEPQACGDGSKIETATSNAQTNAEVAEIVPVKKKLNLEEYKRRRENQLIGDTKIKKTLPCDPIPPNNSNTVNKKQELKNVKEAPKTNYSAALLNKPQTTPVYLKQGKPFYDPILEAKNKVLRMQELKKVAIGKRIDSAVSAKVGPITPILPLEQICGGIKPYNGAANKLNPEYEEIIIVSASCNTEITLAPVFEKQSSNVLPGDQKANPRTAVINPNSLLSNINNNMTKSNCVRLSSNSLLSSIQDVVLKQSTTNLLNGNSLSQKSPNIGVSPPSQFSPQKPEMSHTEEINTLSTNSNKTEHGKQTEHGEDKIIMHLRKDRIRKRTFSVCTQTDDLPQFPPIMKLMAEKVVSSQSTNPKKRKRHYRSRRQSSASSTENGGYRSPSRSHVRYHSISSHGTNRSVSPRSSRYSYSSGRRTASPYRKVHRRSSRSNSRVKYDSDSSTSSSDSGRRSRSRQRRTRRYSSSQSSSSDSSSSSTSSSRSGSRSRSPRSQSRSRYSSGNHQTILNHRRNSSPAVEERRIVYVGRIERETSKEDLKRKFNSYGPIKQITVHYKDTGMKYGFVTFEKPQDAYQVIDRSLNDPRINMYDISFGGRRAFCRQTYSDLDGAATNSFQDLPYSLAPPRTASFKEDSFESLLAKVKEKLSSSRPSTSPSSSTTSSSRCKT